MHALRQLLERTFEVQVIAVGRQDFGVEINGIALIDPAQGV